MILINYRLMIDINMNRVCLLVILICGFSSEENKP